MKNFNSKIPLFLVCLTALSASMFAAQPVQCESRKRKNPGNSEEVQPDQKKAKVALMIKDGERMRCSICRFVNDPSNQACKTCKVVFEVQVEVAPDGEPMVSISEASAGLIADAGQDDSKDLVLIEEEEKIAVAPGHVVCDVCTLDYLIEKAECEACGTANPSAHLQAPRAEVSVDHKTACAQCTFLNDSAFLACGGCGVELTVVSHESEDAGRQVEECAICIDQLFTGHIDNLKILPACDHIFHIDCINEWLQNNATCPLCKKVVPGAPYGIQQNTVVDQELEDYLLAEQIASLEQAPMSPAPRRADQENRMGCIIS